MPMVKVQVPNGLFNLMRFQWEMCVCVRVSVCLFVCLSLCLSVCLCVSGRKRESMQKQFVFVAFEFDNDV